MEKSFPPFLCYPFAGGGYDIRTVQELLGHNDVKTTMIYTHVLNRGPSGVRSPVDGLEGLEKGFYANGPETDFPHIMRINLINC